MIKLFEKTKDVKDLFPVREDSNGNLVWDNHVLVSAEDGYYSSEQDKEYWIGLALSAAKALPGLIKQGKKLLKNRKQIVTKGGKLIEAAAPLLKGMLEKQATPKEEVQETETIGEEEEAGEGVEPTAEQELQDSISPEVIATIAKVVKEQLTQKDFDKLSNAFMEGFKEGLKNNGR